MVRNQLPLIVKGATSVLRGKTLVGPIDLHLEEHGTTVIIGPNGAGKTSLLRLLHGVIRLSAGTVEWACGTQAARHDQAFVFQHPVILRRSVIENIAYPLRVRGVGRSAARHTAAQWAVKVGLGEMLERPAPVLSGGEQQKLALARALITQPAVLFLDEPCAALDGRATKEIEAILEDAKAAGMHIILTTHNMGQARRLGDDIIFLHHGKLHERASADRFFTQPTTAEARAFLNGDIIE